MTPNGPVIPGAVPSAALRVLVVDAQIMRRQQLRFLLEEQGVAKVSLAEDGAQAARILASELLDVVFCAWHLPDMTGLELLPVLARSSPNHKLPLVLYGDDISPRQGVEAVKQGVLTLLRAPLSKTQVRQALAVLLG